MKPFKVLYIPNNDKLIVQAVLIPFCYLKKDLVYHDNDNLTAFAGFQFIKFFNLIGAHQPSLLLSSLNKTFIS